MYRSEKCHRAKEKTQRLHYSWMMTQQQIKLFPSFAASRVPAFVADYIDHFVFDEGFLLHGISCAMVVVKSLALSTQNWENLFNAII